MNYEEYKLRKKKFSARLVCIGVLVLVIGGIINFFAEIKNLLIITFIAYCGIAGLIHLHKLKETPILKKNEQMEIQINSWFPLLPYTKKLKIFNKYK